MRKKLEYYTPFKKSFILRSKGAQFEKFAIALRAVKLFKIFPPRFARRSMALYTSNFLPTPCHMHRRANIAATVTVFTV